MSHTIESSQMIDKETAKNLAQKYLDNWWPDCKIQFVICDEYTIERPFGWVFFWNSKEYLETQDPGQQLGGNAPLIVDRRDGAIHVTGTARSIEEYIESYEQTGRT